MKQFNLDEYFAHPGREVVTRDGRKARIICTNKKPAEYPIVALVEDAESNETEFCFTKEGKLQQNKDHQLDLFFVPEKHEGWINIYRDLFNGTHGIIFNSKEEAIKRVRESYLEEKPLNTYLATGKVTWEE